MERLDTLIENKLKKEENENEDRYFQIEQKNHIPKIKSHRSDKKMKKEGGISYR